MPLSLGFLKKSPDNYMLLTLFDSQKLKTALVFYDDESGMIPKILAHSEEKLPAGVVSSSHIIDINSFGHSLRFGLEKVLSQTSHKNVNGVIVGLSGENIVHTLTTAKIKRPVHSKIEQKELNEHFAKLYETASNNALEHYISVTGNSQEDLETFASSTSYIKLDNTLCTNPLEKECTGLEISWYCAFAPEKALDNVEDSVIKAGLKSKVLGPVIFALTEALKAKLGQYFDAVLLYINEDHTDIGVVFGGSLVDVKTLPLGEETANHNPHLFVNGLEITLKEFSGIKTFANEFLILKEVNTESFMESLNSRDWEKTVPLKNEALFTYIENEHIKSVDIPSSCPLDLSVLAMLKYT